MAAVTICSDFGAQENKVCHCFHFSPFYLPWSGGTRCHCVFSDLWLFTTIFLIVTIKSKTVLPVAAMLSISKAFFPMIPLFFILEFSILQILWEYIAFHNWKNTSAVWKHSEFYKHNAWFQGNGGLRWHKCFLLKHKETNEILTPEICTEGFSRIKRKGLDQNITRESKCVNCRCPP